MDEGRSANLLMAVLIEMNSESIERWTQIFGFSPKGLDTEQLRVRASAHVRQLCTELSQCEERRGISDCLRRIAQVGSILEEYGWLSNRGTRTEGS